MGGSQRKRPRSSKFTPPSTVTNLVFEHSNQMCLRMLDLTSLIYLMEVIEDYLWKPFFSNIDSHYAIRCLDNFEVVRYNESASIESFGKVICTLLRRTVMTLNSEFNLMSIHQWSKYEGKSKSFQTMAYFLTEQRFTIFLQIEACP